MGRCRQARSPPESTVPARRAGAGVIYRAQGPHRRMGLGLRDAGATEDVNQRIAATHRHLVDRSLRRGSTALPRRAWPDNSASRDRPPDRAAVTSSNSSGRSSGPSEAPGCCRRSRRTGISDDRSPDAGQGLLGALRRCVVRALAGGERRARTDIGRRLEQPGAEHASAEAERNARAVAVDSRCRAPLRRWQGWASDYPTWGEDFPGAGDGRDDQPGDNAFLAKKCQQTLSIAGTISSSEVNIAKRGKRGLLPTAIATITRRLPAEQCGLA